ncbi:glucokinase, partial [Stenotrophomonas acidaminiphila]
MDLQTLRGNRVVASFSPTQHLPIAAPAVPLIAADVGGTHVRVGLVRATPDQGIDVIAYRRYRCADHAGLGPILADFHAHAPGARECVIASAGYALADGSVISANLPWPLSAS